MMYDGLDQADLAARVKAPGCLSFARVTSTLDVIHEIAAEDAPAGTLVIADEQVAGRGRQGRRWHSPPGAGIWLGYLMRPERSTESGVLALRVGLAVIRTLSQLDVEARLKWPNDVVVRDRKLAGILCEGRWTEAQLAWVAVGVGMNVHGPIPPELSDRAVALDEVKPGATRISVLEQLVPLLHSLPDLPELTDDECLTLRQHDWLSGKRLREPVAGWAQGVGRDGALLVRTEEGVQRIVGGSVVTA